MSTSTTEFERKAAVLDDIIAGRVIAQSAADIPANFEWVLTLFEILIDFLTIAVAGFLTIHYLLVDSLAMTTSQASGVSAAVALFFVLMLDREGTYRRGNSLLRIRETERILRVSVFVFVPVVLLVAMTHRVTDAMPMIALLGVPAALISEKQLLYLGVRALHAQGYGVERVVIYGAGYTGRRVFSALARSPKLGLNPTAFIDDALEKAGEEVFEPDYRRLRSVVIHEGPVGADLLRDISATLLVVAIPSLDREKFINIVNIAGEAHVSVAFVPTHYVPLDSWVEHADVDGLLLGYFRMAREKRLYEAVKRFCDIVGTLLVGLLFAPIWLLIGLLVKLDSEGPVLFVQNRIGRNGVPFKMYKFRTMYVDAPAYSYSPRAADDTRITKIGRFLRRTSVDEIPQLLNVFAGHMSLVGPRPEMPFIVDGYNPRQRQRLHVPPGITGLWQLSADRAFLIHENIEYDLYYIRNRGFFMDIAILLHTLFFCMRGI